MSWGVSVARRGCRHGSDLAVLCPPAGWWRPESTSQRVVVEGSGMQREASHKLQSCFTYELPFAAMLLAGSKCAASCITSCKMAC